MAQPSKDLIFKTLTTKRHNMAESASLFDTEINNADYWLYTDLYNLFSHPMFDPENMYEHTYQKFDTTPARANKIAPYDFFKAHTIIYNHKYILFVSVAIIVIDLLNDKYIDVKKKVEKNE